MLRRRRFHVLASALMTAGLVAPALAQDTSSEPGDAVAGSAAGESSATICGGLGGVGEWAGGDPSSSDLSSVSAALDVEGQVLPGGQRVSLFFLGAMTDVRLEAVGRPEGDPYLSLFDAEGTEIAGDDDSGGDLAARIDATLSPGAYCLSARSVDHRAMNVALRLGRAGEHEPLTGGSGDGGLACRAPELASLSDESIDTAALEAGVTAVATVAQTPAWGFTLSETLPLTLIAESGAGDPVIRLRDASGVVLAENDDADGTNSRIDLPDALEAGDYCLEMEDLNGATNAVRVALSLFDPVADRLRRIDAAEFSPLPADEVAVRALGPVDTSLIADVATSGAASWVTFDVPEEGVMAIEAIGQGVDPVIVLFDRVGRRVGENDDGPTGLDSQLFQRVRAGSYLMAVRLAGDSAPGNVRVLLERYVPAK